MGSFGRASVVALGLASAQAEAKSAAVKLWRLDCGRIEVADFGLFSDTGQFRGQPRTMASSCYLVRRGSDYLLWDTGVNADLKGKSSKLGPFTQSLRVTIPEQLAQLGLRPNDIKIVALSHYHGDHTGQARLFPQATLLIGKADVDAVRASEPLQPARVALAPWLTGGGKVDAVVGDRDVFGDGSVTMIDLPGHTPGHHALLVRLGSGRLILLAGDEYHSQPSRDTVAVPQFNSNRADTLASHARFEGLAENLKPEVILQHEQGDIGKLPAFPAAAE